MGFSRSSLGRSATCRNTVLVLAVGLGAAGAVSGSGGCSSEETTSPAAAPGSVVLVVPSAGDAITDRLIAEATRYLERQVGVAPVVHRVGSLAGSGGPAGEEARLLALGGLTRAGLVIVLQADRVVPSRVPPAELTSRPVDAFRIETFTGGDHPNGLGDRGATVVLAAGHGALGDQYALYEVLRRLGARFYHPEEELVPAVPAGQLRARAATATAVSRRDEAGAAMVDHVPDFRHRSYTFHFQHPLEHVESFSDGRHPIDEAARVNEWILKNRGDLFRGPGRGIAPPDDAARRAAELEALRATLGMRTTTGITLHNEQQGASAQIDPGSGVPVKDQIEAVVEEALAAVPDAVGFGIHFGPTEYTVTPDEETVQWIEWAGLHARALRPDVPVWINDHTTGSQPTPHFDDRGCPPGTNADGRGDYYDLAFHTDPSLGVSVHTVMFYPLEGPARVYDQRSFAHKLCLMQKASAEGRELVWFPEGSWWLSFDNTVPVWLPLYIGTRGRDVKLLQPLLPSRGGTLTGHKMFNSGHEWGYWQQDYAVGIWHWNTDATLDDVLGELTDGFCPTASWPDGCEAQAEARDVMFDVISHQSAFFLDREDVLGRPGGLYAYFAGEDPADEIGAATGFEFRPVRVAFRDVLAWDDELAATFRATDLAALSEAEAVYATGLARLEAVRGEVPDHGAPFFEEIVDGLAVNELRARHTRQLYEAILALREGDEAGARSAREAAGATLAEVETVIRRREAMYRYPLPQMIGGGITPETGVANGSTYPYRVHTKTSLLTFWTYRQDQVDAILGGDVAGASRLVVTPVFADPGVAASLAWPEADELVVDLTIGGETSIDEPIASLDLGAGEGVHTITGSIRVDGIEIPISGIVARASRRAVAPDGGLLILEPASDVAQETVGSLAPAFHFAITDAALALAPEAAADRDDEPLDFTTAAAAPVAAWEEDGTFLTAATDFVLPIPNGAAGTTLPLHIRDAVFTGVADAGGFVAADGEEMATIGLTGGMVVQDVADALIELAGFDQEGAMSVLAGVLGFDADDPPATVPFSAAFTLEE